MITDRSLFPKHNETYDAILKECSIHNEWIKRADLIKNVYNKNYTNYDVSVIVSDKKKNTVNI